MQVLSLPGLAELTQVMLFALGMSFVVTGSTIGVIIRVPVRMTLGRIGFGNLTLGGVFTCPYCNAWWGGGLTALILGWSWFQILVAAFSSCVWAAIVQAQWALAADEEE